MKRSQVIVAVVAALAIVGGVLGFQYLFGSTNAARFNSACAYAECGWRGHVTIKIGDPYPPVCPSCGRQSVLHLATCPNCGHKQVLNEEARGLPGLENLPENTVCESCGGPIRHGD